MSTGKIDNLSVPLSRLYLRTLIIGVLAFSITYCTPLANGSVESTTGTPYAENVIREVSNVILNFEMLWLSEKSHRDPIFQAELATGEYLDRLSYINSNVQNEVEWFVTDMAELASLRLIEYDQQRFRAEACVTTSGRKIHPNGDLLGLFSDVRVCGIYVFVKIENIWKLLGFLNNMDPRNYEHAPDWLKEIIGEIPQK